MWFLTGPFSNNISNEYYNCMCDLLNSYVFIYKDHREKN